MDTGSPSGTEGPRKRNATRQGSGGAEFVAGLSDEEAERLVFDWPSWARPAQLPPEGDWTTWLLIGGRGSGKTRAGAEWVRALAAGPAPVSPIALAGETLDQARAVMVEGESGLLRIHPDGERPVFDRGRGRLTWPNGAEALLMSGSDPDRFRGPQFAAAWCDEIGKWPDGEAAWDMLQFALRLGERPRQLATTTPRATPLLRRLLADEATAVTRMRTDENATNLAPGFLEAVTGRYRGTVLGRQELDGELIDDPEGALWTRGLISRARARPASPARRMVVAVDPPVTAHAGSDACGIVVAAGDELGATVLADRTLKPAPPVVWARRVAAAFEAHGADAVVVEVNQGGDLVRELLRQVDPGLPVIAVRATRGKWLRAEPVAALYARGLVRHEAGLSELEDEMCAFSADGRVHGGSPDRVDALVWALTELLLARGSPRVRVV